MVLLYRVSRFRTGDRWNVEARRSKIGPRMLTSVTRCSPLLRAGSLGGEHTGNQRLGKSRRGQEKVKREG